MSADTNYLGTGFINDIGRMNATYELESIYTFPDMLTRLVNFGVILGKEFKELQDIIDEGVQTLNSAQVVNTSALQLKLQVMLADLLGDICVYCFSEAARYDFPMAMILQAIMRSNFTKLGADGRPIKDENGKFLKGPGFIPPEASIQHILQWGKGNTTAINYDTPETATAETPVAAKIDMKNGPDFFYKRDPVTGDAIPGSQAPVKE